jgi:hypothetical protein
VASSAPIRASVVGLPVFYHDGLRPAVVDAIG